MQARERGAEKVRVKEQKISVTRSYLMGAKWLTS